MPSNTLDQARRPAIVTGLTATGSSQTTAYQLVTDTRNAFTTTAASTGAILPVATRLPGEVSVFNAGAQTLTVYPPSGGAIDGGSTDAGVSVATLSGTTFWAAGPTAWHSIQTAAAAGAGTGTVTSVASGTGLTGGPVTTTGTLSIAAGGVGTTQLAAGAVTEVKLTLADNTTGDVSITAHGFAPKSPNDATKYLDGTGAYSVPAGGGGGSGTVTTASVVSAHGFAGSIATATTTPAITLSTTVTGILKGDGTSISAASAGTDYLTSPVSIAHGGTGQTTQTAAFDALSPLGTLGDTLCFGATHNVLVAGNISTTKKFYTQTGAGASSAAPAWSTIVSGDIPGSALPSTGLVITQSTHAIAAPAFASTINFDLSTDNFFAPAALTGNVSLTLSNAPASTPWASPFTVILLQDGTGSRLVSSWFSGFTVLWAGGSAPTLTTTINKRDTFCFIQIAATTVLGFVVGQNS